MSGHASQTRRVLIVDDNEDAARSLAYLLSSAGYRVETAFDGATALAIAQHFVPDICILDINMPGMNGYELARRIRESLIENPPLLATMTAYNDALHLDRAVSAGFDLHFTKPVTVEDLIDQLESSVSR